MSIYFSNLTQVASSQHIQPLMRVSEKVVSTLLRKFIHSSYISLFGYTCRAGALGYWFICVL